MKRVENKYIAEQLYYSLWTLNTWTCWCIMGDDYNKYQNRLSISRCWYQSLFKLLRKFKLISSRSWTYASDGWIISYLFSPFLFYMLRYGYFLLFSLLKTLYWMFLQYKERKKPSQPSENISPRVEVPAEQSAAM